jgi:hypothetical protein
MKSLSLLLLFLSFNTYAKLKVGDILLQPLHCWACSLIEAQTKSEYSHIGVVIEVNKDKVYVAEAFHKVKKVSLEEYMAKTEKGSAVKVLRPFAVSQDLQHIFKQEFEGLKYDRDFRWNNYDGDGQMIYCSELLYKLFIRAGMHTPKLNRMQFDINREHWETYFRGNVPDGEIGISPQDFNQDKKYTLIGFL